MTGSILNKLFGFSKGEHIRISSYQGILPVSVSRSNMENFKFAYFGTPKSNGSRVFLFLCFQLPSLRVQRAWTVDRNMAERVVLPGSTEGCSLYVFDAEFCAAYSTYVVFDVLVVDGLNCMPNGYRARYGAFRKAFAKFGSELSSTTNPLVGAFRAVAHLDIVPATSSSLSLGLHLGPSAVAVPKPVFPAAELGEFTAAWLPALRAAGCAGAFDGFVFYRALCSYFPTISIPMGCLKWKPPGSCTVDFRAVQASAEPDVSVIGEPWISSFLWSEMPRDGQLGAQDLQRLMGLDWSPVTDGTSGDWLLVVDIGPADIPSLFRHTASTVCHIAFARVSGVPSSWDSGVIGEFTFDGCCWRAVQQRPDKKHSNRLLTVLKTVDSFVNPVTLEEIQQVAQGASPSSGSGST